MKRHNFHLPEDLVTKAKNFAKNANVSLAEIIRRALEAYIK